MLKAKRNKYGAKKTVVDNLTFASVAESRRYIHLKLLQSAELIGELEVHPQFPLVVAGEKVGNYFADFAYTRDGRKIAEDVKSRPTKTPLYRFKIKVARALYPQIEFVEVM